MTPSDYNLPPKFTEFREAQIEAIHFTLGSEKRFRMLALPVGSGKSLFSMAVAKHFNRTAVLTATKGLQTQYCLTPDVKVLTADLRHVPLGEIKVGDNLFGFDEHRDGSRRRWRESTVLSANRVILPCYKITLESGKEFVCSGEHQWLVRQTGGGAQWKTTDSLRVDDTKYSSKICKLCDVWEHTPDYSTGYLAAAFDGEGHFNSRQFCSFTHGKIAEIGLVFSQKPNPMLWQVIDCLDQKGFKYNLTYGPGNVCAQVHISGRKEVMRFLGEIRPHRLLPKVDPERFGMIGPITTDQVVSREFVGDRELVAISTSTNTFVADGYGSHNCDDFGSTGMVEIRGRQNYLCDVADNCKLGGHLRCTSQRDESCPYVQKYNEAKAGEHVITNYSYWLNVMNKGQGLGTFDCLILDEAHDADKALSSYLDFNITEGEIERFDLPSPKLCQEDLALWGRWAAHAELKLKTHLSTTRNPHHRALEQERMETLLDRLARLLTLNDRNWVCELSEGSKYGRFWKFNCVWPGQYGEMLFRGIPNVILMSGTIF